MIPAKASNGFMFSPKAVTSSAKGYTVWQIQNVPFCLPPLGGTSDFPSQGDFSNGLLNPPRPPFQKGGVFGLTLMTLTLGLTMVEKSNS
jgi:hypothetical protein